MRCLSLEARRLLREGKGYNCEPYGEHAGPLPFDRVLEHEVLEKGNEHILDEISGALGVLCPPEPKECLRMLVGELGRRFGRGSKAIWLGPREEVRDRYCGGREEDVVEYEIPKGAFVLSDLGPEGVLFLFPESVSSS